ncbi:MAG TPA: branched-chain amino acid ABC transporter permease [Mycobacteriales bacterium]|nr:branched-chain amino acid ABC transporter permease [Mycobacteriales bacterium]
MEVLVQGALTSATIALVALGFSLVYGVGGILNLAHGSFFMIGAYGAYATHDAGAPLGVAALVGVGCAVAAGILLDRLVIAPIRRQDTALLIATLAVAILVQSVVEFSFGTADRQLPGFADGAVSLLGVDVQSSRALAGAVAAVTIVAVLLVLHRTPAGRMVRAVAEDPEAAVLVGVRPERVTLYVIAIGAGLAGLAGVMVAPYAVVNPGMWLLPLTQAFAIVILGGLGSVWGTVLASFVVGYLDRFVAYEVPEGEVKVGLVTIVVIIATLVIRPFGLLGKAGGAH